jgi:hypothetical protein
MTVVLTSSSGLEIFDVGKSQWVDVNSIKGSDAVILFGDSFSSLTGESFKSPLLIIF